MRIKNWVKGKGLELSSTKNEETLDVENESVCLARTLVDKTYWIYYKNKRLSQKVWFEQQTYINLFCRPFKKEDSLLIIVHITYVIFNRLICYVWYWYAHMDWGL